MEELKVGGQEEMPFFFDQAKHYRHETNRPTEHASGKNADRSKFVESTRVGTKRSECSKFR